eukprot:260166-Pelagomonas_calceolata.AAC.1
MMYKMKNMCCSNVPIPGSALSVNSCAGGPGHGQQGKALLFTHSQPTHKKRKKNKCAVKTLPTSNRIRGYLRLRHHAPPPPREEINEKANALKMGFGHTRGGGLLDGPQTLQGYKEKEGLQSKRPTASLFIKKKKFM